MGSPRTAKPTTEIFGMETETGERREEHELDRLEKHTEQNKKEKQVEGLQSGNM